MRDWLANTEPFLLSLLSRGREAAGTRPALWTWENGDWRVRDWRTIAADVCRTAARLAEFGVRRATPIAQIADNCYAWIVTDLALLGIGAIHVPMHTALPIDHLNRQLLHCEANTVILGERQAGLAGQLVVAQTLSHKSIVRAAGDTDTSEIDTSKAGMSNAGTSKVSTSEAGIAAIVEAATGEAATGEAATGEAATGEAAILRTQRDLDPHEPATIIYTSGTLGEPKGVVLSHRNLRANTNSILQAFVERETERRFCLLPFSHVYARVCDLYVWVANGTEMAVGTRPDALGEDLRAIGPTFLNGVPLFFDRVRRQLQAAGADRRPGALRAALGGRVELCVSGGAATPEPLYDFFHDQGVPLLPGYGLTEASPVVAASTARDCERGAVGRPLPGVVVRLADDGEILTRGPHVMRGYHRDEAATAATVRDGWLHTGDLGAWTDTGLLQVVGRKKECFALATGKKVAPAALELRLLEDPRVVQAAIIGDGRDCLVALVFLRPFGEVPAHQNSTTAGDASAANPNETSASSAMRTAAPMAAGMAAGVAPRGTQELATFSATFAATEVAKWVGERQRDWAAHERIRGLLVVERPFSVESGECTPKMTLCRPVIELHYRHAIRGLYAALRSVPRRDSPLLLAVADAEAWAGDSERQLP